MNDCHVSKWTDIKNGVWIKKNLLTWLFVWCKGNGGIQCLKWMAMKYLIKTIKHKKLIQRHSHDGNEYFPKVICWLFWPQRHNEMICIIYKVQFTKACKFQLKLKYCKIALKKEKNIYIYIKQTIRLEHQKIKRKKEWKKLKR